MVVSETKQEEPTISPLKKQNSILSLTLDEIQCKSGMSFGSMSMDEFLTSIWIPEDNNKVTSHPQIPHDDSAQKDKSAVQVTEPIIPQQASFFVPSLICKKTVDEVWSEIHKDQPQQNEANEITKNVTLKKEQTFGEMTLEDFLIKAGVVQECSLPLFNSSSPEPKPAVPFQNQTRLRPAMRLRFCTQKINVGNGIAGYPKLSQRNSTSGSGVQKLESMQETSGVSGRKRIIDGPPEGAVERRQRRMLKNRESAARSRARRQVPVSSNFVTLTMHFCI